MKIHGWKTNFLYHLHLFTSWFFTWSTRLFVEPNFNDQTNNKLFATHVIGITCSIRDSDSHTSWWLILGKETTVLIEGPREKMGILRKHGVETLAFYPTSKTNISTYYPWRLWLLTWDDPPTTPKHEAKPPWHLRRYDWKTMTGGSSQDES